MTELIIVAIVYIVLALLLCIRLIKGPTVADRVVAADSIDALTVGALVLFSVFSGRGIYLDIAIVAALLGFISTVVISRHMEGRL